MNISILVNEVAGGWSPNATRLGGTEESVIKWAEGLEHRGNRVEVFHNSPDGHYEEVNHVIYRPRAAYLGGGDVCLNVKCSDISPREPTVYFTNELDAGRKDLSAYRAVVWPSHWAADNIPVNNKMVKVVPHGYDPEAIYSARKVPKQCFYASSPDRGLETLLAAWPKVYEAHPDATLLLTYGVRGIDLPGVVCLGEVPEEMMNDVYRTSDIWCHPANGGELFCMTGVKAQVAQCVPVIYPVMALQETVKAYWPAEGRSYADMLIECLRDENGRQFIRNELASEHFTTWEESTTRLYETVMSVL